MDSTRGDFLFPEFDYHTEKEALIGQIRGCGSTETAQKLITRLLSFRNLQKSDLYYLALEAELLNVRGMALEALEKMEASQVRIGKVRLLHSFEKKVNKLKKKLQRELYGKK